MNNTVRRAASSALSAAVIAATCASPALAGKDYDGQDRGESMPVGEAILTFGVLPAAISFGIALIVLLPDWFRKAQSSSRGGYLDDPTLADRESLSTAERAQLGQ